MYLQQKQLLIEEKTTMLQNELRSYLKNPGETLNDRKVKNLIKEALDIHDADKLGLRGYCFNILLFIERCIHDIKLNLIIYRLRFGISWRFNCFDT